MSVKESKPASYPIPRRIIVACQIVLRDRLSLLLIAVLTPVIALALYLIPVHMIPGNTMAMQSGLYQTNDYILLAFIAGLESLLIVMYVYKVRHRRDHIRLSGGGKIGFLSGIPAFLFGAKACPMMMVALFGGFGSGIVVFALHHLQWFFVISMIALLWSLSSVAGKIASTDGTAALPA